MTDKTRFVKADGTLLSGKDAEQELAKHDAEKILKELGMEEGVQGSNKQGTKPKDKETFEGKGRRLKSGVGVQTTDSVSSSSLPGPYGPAPIQRQITLPDPTGSDNSGSKARGDRESAARDEADERETRTKIANAWPQIDFDAQEIWKFSKDAEDGVYHFSLDLDTLWKKTFGTLQTVQAKINEVASEVNSYLDRASGMTDSAKDALDTWGDMTQNIRKGTEMLDSKVKEKTEEVTGFTRNLNDRAQNLAKTATSTLNNPLLKNVAGMTVVSDTISEMAGAGEYLTSTFDGFVKDQSAKMQEFITNFSQMVIDFGESSGVFGFIREAASEISKLLKTLSGLLAKIKEKIGGFLNKINGIFEKIFTWVAKIRSVIEGVLGLDLELMKEALKNGTIRLADVRVGTVRAALVTEVKTKSSTDISAAKLTAGNVSAAGIVRDNSKSGHIEVTAVDVKTGNVDAALMREGKFKRNLAYLKGAGVNAGNVRSTLIDDREGDTAVVGASAAEVNVGNVEAFGLGRKGTHKQATVQPSLNVGNVAIGVRRSTGTNLRAGPQFSAFNADLTVGAPSLSNFLNQIAPGQAFGNIAIPFFGGGGGEAGGKSSGDKGSGMPPETAGDSTYGLARDTVEFGDRLPQGGQTGGGGVVLGPGSDHEGVAGSEVTVCNGNGPDSSGRQNAGENQATTQSISQYGEDGGDGDRNEKMSGPDATGGAGYYRKSDSVRGNGTFMTGSSHSGFDTGNSRTDVKTNDGLTGFSSARYSSNSNSKSESLFSFLDGGKANGGSDKSVSRDDSTRAGPQLFAGSSGGSPDHTPDQTFSGNREHGSKIHSQSQMSGSSNSSFHNESHSSEKHKTSTGNDGQGNTNTLGSGIYKTGDGLGKKDEDDYQSKLVSLVKGRVQDKVGKKSENEKRGKKPEDKPKKLDKEDLKRQLLKECQDELEQAEGSGSAEAGKEEKSQTKSKRKPKAKPWGEHGNIHGFSTLGMESDKEVKKLGEGIYGFGDG